MTLVTIWIFALFHMFRPQQLKVPLLKIQIQQLKKSLH